MRAYCFALAIFSTFAFSPNASAQSFGDFQCTVDCSGHEAGYEWAQRKGIDDEYDCPQGNSQSFHEGCIAYTRDNTRDPDPDDDRSMAGRPANKPMDFDDDDDDDDK